MLWTKSESVSFEALAALDSAGVAYAVVGGNAVATWVAKIDESTVRNTQDVDILLRRSDLEAASIALATVGFISRHVKGIDLFLDGPGAKAREAIHIFFAGEKVQPEYACPCPDVSESERSDTYQVLSLPALIRMKLTSFRLKGPGPPARPDRRRADRRVDHRDGPGRTRPPVTRADRQPRLVSRSRRRRERARGLRLSPV